MASFHVDAIMKADVRKSFLPLQLLSSGLLLSYALQIKSSVHDLYFGMMSLMV